MQKPAPGEIDQAVLDPDIPNIYANGFSCALGLGDVAVLLKNGPRPIGVLNMSFTTAKTLAEKLLGLVSFLEEKSGNRVLNTEEVKAVFTRDPKSQTSKLH